MWSPGAYALIRLRSASFLPPQTVCLSAETAVLSVHNDLVRSIDRGEVSALVLLDLGSAFDTVNHDTLRSVLSTRFSAHESAVL